MIVAPGASGPARSGHSADVSSTLSAVSAGVPASSVIVMLDRYVPPVLVTSNVNVTGPGVSFTNNASSAASPAVLIISIPGTKVTASSSSAGSLNSGFPLSSRNSSPFSSVGVPEVLAVFWLNGPSTSISNSHVTEARGAIGPSNPGHSAAVNVMLSAASVVPRSSVIVTSVRNVPPVFSTM